MKRFMNRRGVILSLLWLSACYGAGLLASEPAQPVARPAPAVSAADDTEVTDVLIPELRLEKVTLDAAVNKLQEATGANILVRWRELEEAQVDLTGEIKLHLWNVRLKKALQIVLDAILAPDQGVTIEDRDGILTIGKPDSHSVKLPLKIYDIRDLLEALRKERGEQSDETTYETAEEITRLVMEQVDPDSWRDNGGTAGMRYLAGRLFINQTPAAHKQLQIFFAQLRTELAKPRATLNDSLQSRLKTRIGDDGPHDTADPK